MVSQLKVNEIIKQSGSSITIGEAGDTVSGPFTNKPAFSAYLSSAQTISGSTWTKVAFDGEYFDTDSAFDTSNNRFTVPSNLAGKYCFIGQINMEYIDDNKTFRMSWYKMDLQQ